MSLLQNDEALLYAVALYRETLFRQCGAEAAEVVVALVDHGVYLFRRYCPPPR